MSETPTFRVAIIGAGITGIAQAIRLKEQLGDQVQFTVFERDDGPGGNWRQAKWPGACSDVDIHLYELDGEPNPYWTRKFPHQPEILSYWEGLIAKHDLHSHFRYNSTFIGSSWSSEDQLHTVSFLRPSGERFEYVCNAIISANGPLSTPVVPDLPGREKFQGKSFHSLAWDDELDFKGKKVAVVGNGSTGIQVVPSLATIEGIQITQFIRSGCWLIPKVDESFSPVFRFALRWLPGLQAYYRKKAFNETHGAWSTEVTEGPTPFETYLTSYLKKEAPAKYLSILTPSYPFGCKRPAHDQGWLRALHRDNVELVGNKITEVVEHGLVTEDGTHRQFDVVIYATGCDVAETGVGLNENVKGEAGLELREHWKSIGGPQAYRSTALPKFPNTFTVLGPNAVAGSWGHTISMVENNLSSLQPTQSAFIAHNEQIVSALKSSPQASPLCTNWWRTASGRITVSHYLSAAQIEEEARSIEWKDWVATQLVAKEEGKVELVEVDMSSRAIVKTVKKASTSAFIAFIAVLVTQGASFSDGFADFLRGLFARAF